MLSVITPAYNESCNLPILYERLCHTMSEQGLVWEWIVVDDHSLDDTFSVAAHLAEYDSRVYAIRLARRFGSHRALTCGLLEASGDCAVVMAADLQDPPEVLPSLLKAWRDGAQVVWAVRAKREGESVINLLLARMYYLSMRHLVGFKQMPISGADFFLIDRRVVEALRTFRENHVNIFALIAWMGFRQTNIAYHKQARRHGRSGWDLRMKVKLLIDSVVSFTFLPVRFASYLGLIVVLMGIIYSARAVLDSLRGHAVGEWSLLIVAVLLLGGLQILMMGVLGEYLWRTLEESRCRPRYLIEAATAKQRPVRIRDEEPRTVA